MGVRGPGVFWIKFSVDTSTRYHGKKSYKAQIEDHDTSDNMYKYKLPIPQITATWTSTQARYAVKASA